MLVLLTYLESLIKRIKIIMLKYIIILIKDLYRVVYSFRITSTVHIVNV